MPGPEKITSLEALLALYGAANPTSLAKETRQLTPEYRRWIEAAPFFAIASCGAAGLDCSPRGDARGQLFRVLDERTFAIPDRRGNNRLDTLRNIIADPRIALLFLMPGIDECVRINGRASITADAELIDSFAVGDRKPATVILVEIDAVYFQCARALTRARLWDRSTHADREAVPTAGQMTRSALPSFDAETYDTQLAPRHKETLY
jgi:PPOX class probable FMN-dependent enzyme